MTTTPRLAADETYVDGRSSKRAAELLGYAKESGASVRTTSHGYIVPTDILPDGFDGDTLTEESRPAVHTEPGTDPDAANVYNVGQAPAHDTFAQAEESAAPVEATQAQDEELPATPETPGNDEVPNPETDEEPAEEFDPSKATVDEVIAYLDGADEAEVERVLAAEADGKNRKGIAEYTTEGEK